MASSVVPGNGGTPNFRPIPHEVERWTAATGRGRPPSDAGLREEVLPFALLLAGALRPDGRVEPLGRELAPLLREVVDGRVAMIRRVGESTL